MRTEIKCINYPSNFNVLDDVTSNRHIRKAKNNYLKTITNVAFKDQIETALRELPYGFIENQIVEVNSKVNALNFPEKITNFLKVTKSGEINTLFDSIFKEYSKFKFDNKSLDFHDLLVYTAKILHDFPDIRQKYQNKFSFVMGDEFQDIDPLQYEILRLLSENHKNIFVVGDPNQCIYE